MTYDQNEGLGAAMMQSHSDSRITALEDRVTQLEMILRMQGYCQPMDTAARMTAANTSKGTGNDRS